MKRRMLWLGALSVIALAVAAYFLFGDGDGADGADATAQTGSAVVGESEADVRPLKFERRKSLWDEPMAAKGELVVSGRVVDEAGSPVADAVVTATGMHGDDVLSDLDCKCDNECGRKLLECGCPEASHQMVDLVATRTGEAPPLSRTRTDGEGRFTLVGLQEGELALWADAPGRIGFRARVRVGDSSVEVQLEQGRVVRGVVKDADKRPLPGALVTAIYAEHSRFFDAVADSEGKFSVGPLPKKGSVAMVAMKDGLLPGTAHAREDDSAEDEEIILYVPRTLAGLVSRGDEPVAGVEVKLEGEHRKRTTRTGGDGRFLFAHLHPGSYDLRALAGSDVASAKEELSPTEDRTDVVLELIAGFPVTGSVTDAAGKPLSDVTVSISRNARGDWAKTKTAADGTFVTEAVAPGDHWIHAAAEGFIKADSEKVVVAGPATHHQLKLTADSPIFGRTVDEAGVVITGARVSAMMEWDAEDMSAMTERFDGEGRHASTEAKDGGFALRGLVAGKKYTVTAAHEELTGASVVVTTPAKDVVLMLRGGTRVFGSVVDEAGRGLPAVEVTLKPKKSGLDDKDTETADGGLFELRGVAAGDYTLEARPASNWRSEVYEVTSTRAKQELSVGGSPVEVRLVLKEGPSFVGTVVDDARKPVAGARVSGGSGGADKEFQYAASATKADGTFKLSGLSGEVFLDISADGFVPKSVKARTNSVFVLERTGTVVGRVVTSDGKPVKDYFVNSERFNAADGRFEISDEGKTKLTLMFRASNLADRGLTVAVKSKRTDVGDVVLDQGHALSGLVRDARTGVPIVGALVDVGDSSMGLGPGAFYLSERLGAVKTDSQGKFRLQRVSSTADELVATHPEYLDVVAPLAASDSSRELLMTAGGTIEGQLTDNGKPVRGAVSVMLTTYRMRATALLRPDGRFELKGLPPGRYALIAQTRPPLALDAPIVELKSGDRKRVVFTPLNEPVSASFEVFDGSGPVESPTVVLIRGGWAGPREGLLMGAADQPTYVWNGESGPLRIPAGSYTAIAMRLRERDWEYFSQTVEFGPETGGPIRLQGSSWTAVESKAMSGGFAVDSE